MSQIPYIKLTMLAQTRFPLWCDCSSLSNINQIHSGYIIFWSEYSSLSEFDLYYSSLRYMYLYTHWKKTYPMKCWWVHLGKHSIWVLPCLLTTSSILLLAQHQIIEGQPTPSFKNDAKSLEKQHRLHHTLCNRKMMVQ